jgi:PAS domain S-box-containing protein
LDIVDCRMRTEMSQWAPYLEDAPIGILLTDMQLSLKAANHAAATMLGEIPSELEGMNVRDFILESDSDIFRNMLEDPESTPVRSGRFKTCRGEPLHVRVNVTRDGSSFIWFLEDRTEATDLVSSLESMRTLPREYGHDINNLLTVILSATQMIQMDLEGGSPFHEDLSDIMEASTRAAALTRQFMNLGRKLVIRSTTFSLDGLVQEVQPLLMDIMKGELSLALASGSQVIHAPRLSVEAALYQLCMHGRESYSTQPATLRSDSLQLPISFSAPGLGLPSGPYLSLSLVEEGYSCTPESLCSLDGLEPDESDFLSLAWDGITRSRGGIAQRANKDARMCTSLYFPVLNETDIEELL